MRRYRQLVPCLLAAGVAFSVHIPALFARFVYADMAQVLENPWIRDLRHIGAIFGGGVWSFRSGNASSNYYRPAMHTIYALEVRLFGFEPWGFHLVNVLLHAAVSALVVLLVSRLVSDLRTREAFPAFLSPALAAGLLFATHPVHTEAVAWVASLPELSFTLFGLLSFLAFIRSEGTWNRWVWISVGLFFASTLCKETALVLPALLGLYELLRRRPSPEDLLRRLAPFAVAAAFSLALRFRALSGFAPEARWSELTTFQCVLNAFPLFAKYLLKLVLPIDLNAFHLLHPVLSPLEPRALVGVFVAVAFVAASVLALRRSALVFFSLQAIALPLLPVLYIRVVGENAFAESYLYLPSLGFSILCALALFQLPGTRGRAALLAGLVALYGAGTAFRCMGWRDNYTLFRDTASKSPGHFHPQESLANALFERGELDAAIDRYRIALSLSPSQVNARRNLGVAYLRTGRVDEAIAELSVVTAMASGEPKAHAALGFAYERKGLLDAAVVEYEKGLALDPDAAEAHNNLGVAYWKLGRTGRAAERFAAALRLQPGNRRYAENLGLCSELPRFPSK